jgi:arylsulfate sulfotransferase
MSRICTILVALLAATVLTGCGTSMSGTSTSTAHGSSTITATNNPQVAKYTYNAPSAGSVKVQFGPDLSYGRSTWSVDAPAAGPISLLVAGMKANTTYHLQAIFTGKSSTIKDTDYTFTTGGVPSAFAMTVKAVTANGQTPQPGIEIMNGVASGGLPGTIATDLEGNIIWTYINAADLAAGISDNPVRLLPNGDILMLVAHSSSSLLTNATGTDTNAEIREVDLAGDLVQNLSIADLNSRLAANGFSIVGGAFSHEILPLSNGHFLTFVTTLKSVTLSGASTPTTVLGDVVVDLDSTLQPVWVWNTFDHLDVNRHPFNFPDWTHANSISYDSADGSIVISLRHQNWVLKINYANGTGDGSILWHLGPDGDFTLLDSAGVPDTDPKDWFYSQHYANVLSTPSTGVLNLALMDNGDDRQFSDGSSCPANGGVYCYTTTPIFQLDETAKTAKVLFRQILTPDLYSFFGGNNSLLTNGHVEYDLAGIANVNAAVYEVTDEALPQSVWSLQIGGGYAYRGTRWASLYPGVQW